MRALEEAGLPAGVANLVLGAGPDGWARRCPSTRDVDLVSFTGGWSVGHAASWPAAAPTVKRVALELGGKNPNVVFADADFETAVDFALTAVFLHSGQVCSAGARLIVEESLHDGSSTRWSQRAERIPLGGPFDPDAETGPLISAAHRDKVEAYVAAGVAEGAVLRCGGRRPDDRDWPTASSIPPTVLDGCHSACGAAHEESFGPVLTVETFTDEDDAVRIGQRHRLRAGRRGVDPGRGQGPAGREAAAARHGLDQRLPPLRAAGGVGRLQAVRQRPRARPAGLDEYRETKHIWQNINPRPERWFRRMNPRRPLHSDRPTAQEVRRFRWPSTQNSAPTAVVDPAQPRAQRRRSACRRTVEGLRRQGFRASPCDETLERLERPGHQGADRMRGRRARRQLRRGAAARCSS